MSDLSWLNPTPHAIAVYASQPLSPVATQHSLPSGRYSLLGPDFHRLDRTSLAWPTPRIPSSARASSVGGTVMPRALAVFIAWHPRALPAKFVEQFLRPPQIVRAEAARKPIGDRGQQLKGLLSVTPLCPKAGEAGRRTELPGLRLLLSRYVNRP